MKTTKMINVLQLVEGFGWGGAEKKLLELVKCMDPTRFKTTICSLGIVNHIREEFESIGIKVVTLRRKKRIDLSLVPKVARLIKEEKIDVVMTTLFYADMVGTLAGKMANVKGIFLWETISAPEWLIKRRLWPYMFAIRFCSRIISVSEATARFLNKKRHVPAHKIRVIPYGVDLKKYKVDNNSEIRKKMGLNGQNLVIGVVGRLHQQKGHIYLIEASERIIKEFPEVKFVFAGDGALRGELEKRIQDKNLEKNFLLLGYRSDIPEVLKSLDIFVLPSLYEGLPNVVLEAMASGKPVVATSVDGTVEAVINNVTGFLIPPKNIEELQNAILKVLRDKDMAKQMGRKGRERVEKHFSLENQVQSFEKLYSSIVQ